MTIGKITENEMRACEVFVDTMTKGKMTVQNDCR